MVSFVCVLLDFDIFWTNSCCDRARQKPILDSFAKMKADRKREFDAALAVAKAKKIKLAEAEKAEKKYLEETQKGPPVELSNDELDRKLVCHVCKERYNDEDRAMSSLPCRHIFCQRCLEMTNPKICPGCRADYKNEDIKKLVFL